MLKIVREQLQKDAHIIAEQLETAFGSPKRVTYDEICGGYGISLSFGRMGFGSGKTYLVTVVLDDGGL